MAEPDHVFPLRVYYEDTDAAGIVYYANYLKFAERARTEWLRAKGIGQRELSEDEGVAFAVRRVSVEYLMPARLDDALEVRTRIVAVRGASLDGEQEIARGGQVLTQLSLTLACVARDGRPARLPEVVRRALGLVSPQFRKNNDK
ncbi:MAG: tol-pal system-associated acyl-CoA thioesterase [Alphaproteobacteria bacterium]|nr:tol-pal system-associated acyl-CoA thioesterase [Alphaproteobacteria bacterium]